jgi:hypothetical protein
MTGQQSEYSGKSNLGQPFKDFVSRCRDHKLTERVNEYRAEMDTLIKQDKGKPVKGALSGEGYFLDFISEIANQGDFESLELLEKDLAINWRYEFWLGVAEHDNMDGAKKLLVKWAIENPTEPMLMKYHPNGLNLLIEMAEDKRSGKRAVCLRILAHMPDAIKVLDRIKALTSDQSRYFQIGEVRWVHSTVGSVAEETVKEIEQRKLQKK